MKILYLSSSTLSFRWWLSIIVSLAPPSGSIAVGTQRRLLKKKNKTIVAKS